MSDLGKYAAVTVEAVSRLQSALTVAIQENARITAESARLRQALKEVAALKGMQRANPFGQGGYNEGHCAGSFAAYDEAADIARAALEATNDPE